MQSSSPDVPTTAELAAIAHRLADAAGAATLPSFRSQNLAVENKDICGFDPVTSADRAAETAIRSVLAEARPDDAILGEEEARRDGTSGLTWIIDPIDGTRAFLIGAPTWGTLIALADADGMRLGMVDQPFTGERWWGARDLGAWYRRGDDAAKIRTRPSAALGGALMATTAPELFDAEEHAAFVELRSCVKLCRYGLDCYAYTLVASGHLDLVVEAGLQSYDIAAHIPLIEAAGGIVTGWRGEDCRNGGRAIAAGDARIHAMALEILKYVP